MYSVFIKHGAAQEARPYKYGQPAIEDAPTTADTNLIATPHHDCAMHIKQTLENMGRFLRRSHVSAFMPLLEWAKQDAQTVGVDDETATKVAKTIFEKWLESKVNSQAHQVKSISPKQLANLAHTYIRLRAAEFMIHGGLGGPEEVEALTVPVSQTYTGSQADSPYEVSSKLTPANIRVVKLSPEEISAHVAHKTGDSRFVRMKRR